MTSPTAVSMALRASIACLVAIFTMSFSPLQAEATPTKLSAGITPLFYSGTYGTANTTDIFYVPVDFKLQADNLTLKATIPYLRVNSPNAVLAGGAVVGNAAGLPQTRSGLGDIWLEARYRVKLDATGNRFYPYVKYKLGTASRTNGLGTGANDVEFGGIFRSRIGHDYYPFAKLGYRIQGNASGLVLNNFYTYQLGLSYAVDVDHVATILYSGHQSAQPGLAAASEVIAAWTNRFQSGYNLQLYGLLGLSNGSPDYGIGFSLRYTF